MPRNVLIADANDSLVERIRWALSEQGYGVRTAQSSEDVMRHTEAATIDLLVIGDTLPGQGWRALLTRLRQDRISNALPVIMLTANIDDIQALIAWHEGIDSFQSTRESALPVLTLELSAKIKRIFRSLEEDGSP